MTHEEFRHEMEKYRVAIWDEYSRSAGKDPRPLRGFLDLYQRFDAEERAMADDVFADWILSEDRMVRGEALWPIEHFKIVKALPALEELVQRLTKRSRWRPFARNYDPNAAFELEGVKRTIAILTEK